MPDAENPQKKENDKREFMRETIVRQPLSRRQLAKRAAAFLVFAVLFGGIAAVSFVLAEPLARKVLDMDSAKESSYIMIEKDESETEAVETQAPTDSPEEADRDMEEAVSRAVSEQTVSIETLNGLYNSVREIGQKADKGIVTVRSGKQHLDLFGNPVENIGDYAGAVIAKTESEFLIFTDADAVRQADSVSITFYDGTEAAGQSRQIDEVLNMAVISVSMDALSQEAAEAVGVIGFGNSYAMKAGDFVIGAGGPAGTVHSTSYGTIAYVVRNVKMVDGLARVFYADICSDSSIGTFLLNTAGELIGWTTEDLEAEENSDISTVFSISDYKAVLGNMMNGQPSPYFGVRGQEVNEAMTEAGIPSGIYVIESVSGSPAYETGIQNGDIIIQFGDKEITTLKELQNQIENSESGFSVPVKVMRKGREGYKELEYQIGIRAR